MSGITYPTARQRAKAKKLTPVPAPYRTATPAAIADLRALVLSVKADSERLAEIDMTTEDLPDNVKTLVRQARRQGELMRTHLDEWRDHYRGDRQSIALGRYNEFQQAAHDFFKTIERLAKVDTANANEWLDILDLADVEA